jgi:hypothetical protein
MSAAGLHPGCLATTKEALERESSVGVKYM